MTNRLISVIIPARNREKTVGYCLNSVLTQTYQNFEVIVIDDGSTDATVSLVNKIDDPRVRIISHAIACGAQKARNTGIKAAKGDWIGFLDSDDEWYPEKLSRQVAVLDARNWDERIVVHGDMIVYYPESKIRSHWKLPLISGKDCYADLLRAPGPVFQTLLVSKKALLEIGLLDENVPSYQEWETSIRLAKICEFVHLQEPLAVYWLHSGETISKDKGRDIDGYQYVIEKHRKEIERVLGSNCWNQIWIDLIYRCASFGLFKEANALLNSIPILSYWRLYGYLGLFMQRLKNWKLKHLGLNAS